ncbi:LexA family protein [Niallia sp. FSL K6-0077]|uniref:LexA family protein n=1 Tax=Niallia sp. FSL K6-0077 TaxID=2954743 RepID=UPI0030F72567
MHNQLTQKQQNVLNALEIYINENGYSPSYRQLAKVVNLKSSSTVSGYLLRLKEAGYVTWEEGCPRTLSIIKKEAQLV